MNYYFPALKIHHLEEKSTAYEEFIPFFKSLAYNRGLWRHYPSNSSPLYRITWHISQSALVESEH